MTDKRGQAWLFKEMLGFDRPSDVDSMTAFTKALMDAFHGIKRGVPVEAAASLTQPELDEIKRLGDIAFVATSSVGSSVFVSELKSLGSVTHDSGSEKPYCEGVVLSQVVPAPDGATDAAVQFRTHLAT